MPGPPHPNIILKLTHQLSLTPPSIVSDWDSRVGSWDGTLQINDVMGEARREDEAALCQSQPVPAGPHPMPVLLVCSPQALRLVLAQVSSAPPPSSDTFMARMCLLDFREPIRLPLTRQLPDSASTWLLWNQEDSPLLPLLKAGSKHLIPHWASGSSLQNGCSPFPWGAPGVLMK